MYIDTHAHLTSKEFDADRDEVIRRAMDAGVSFIVNPSVNVDDSRMAIALAERYDNIVACVGIHPHEAGKTDGKSLREIEALSGHEKVVAIGEIGLDYHYDFAPKDVQKDVFRGQLRIAAEKNLPVVIHTRESIPDTIGIVEECIREHPGWRSRSGNRPAPRGVFHCFSGDLDTARRVISLRFYISFPGLVTFRNAAEAQSVAAGVPLDDLLLETDSPYLAPVPHRGKRNESMNIPLIARKIAELQESTVEVVARTTGYNAYDLFGIGDPEPPDAA